MYDSFARMNYKMDTTKQYTTKISALMKILKDKNTKLRVPATVVKAEPGYFLTRTEWEDRKISEKLENFFKKKAEKSKNPKNPLLFQKDFLLNLSKFPRSKFAPNIYELPLLVDENALFFESNFESGNLRKVYRVNDFEYTLVLEFDVMTDSYSQWYFFNVSNIKKGIFNKILLTCY